MRRSPGFLRLTAGVALAALCGQAAGPFAAIAQPAPPPLPPVAGDPLSAQTQADPPQQVGRVASINGVVSFRNEHDEQWSAAVLNYPVSRGTTFWTEPSAQAALELSGGRADLAGATEFGVSALNPSGVQATLGQGELFCDLPGLAPNETWSVQTPRGLVQLVAAGRYDIVVGNTDEPTRVTVLAGAARLQAPGVALTVNADETATVTGGGPFAGNIGPAVGTAFLTSRLNADRPAALPPPAAVPQAVSAMPGGSDLYATGSWSDTPDYGEVWYPPVSPGWVPYRDGRWAYVAPWGWTWVDNAPWGFAPFHYGRWIETGDRWGWTPGIAAAASSPPVYAPALVAFVGAGAGAGLGAALAAGSVGWVPLGPREPYHPWYPASPRYLRAVNARHVSNTTIINNGTINNFINRGAATVVPAAVMTGSRPVQGAAQPIPPQALAGVRPIVGQQPIRPSAATTGITPAVARQLRLAPAAERPAAPGPAIPTRAFGVAVGSRPPLPERMGRMYPAAGAATPSAAPPVVPPPLISGNRPGIVAPQAPNRLATPGGVHPFAAAPSGTNVPPPIPAVGARPPFVPAPRQPTAPVAGGRGEPGMAISPGRPAVREPPSRAADPLLMPNHAGGAAQAPGTTSVLNPNEPRPGPAGSSVLNGAPAPERRAFGEPFPRTAPIARPVEPPRPFPETRPVPLQHPLPAMQAAPPPRPMPEPRLLPEPRPAPTVQRFEPQAPRPAPPGPQAVPRPMPQAAPGPVPQAAPRPAPAPVPAQAGRGRPS